MRRTAAGDDDAFAVLVQRHENLVYGTVAKMLGGPGPDAEDLSQDIFIRVYKSAARYRPSAKFTTWLLTICRRRVFTYCKWRKRRRLFFPIKDENSAEPEPADVKTATSRDHLMQQELEDAVDRALAVLPENQRLAVVLRQYEQLDYEQIAKVLGVTLPSVKSLLFRARETLKKQLQQYLRG